MTDEFYIGWQGKAPAIISRHVRRAVVLLGVTAVAIALAAAFAQRTIGVAVFEWGIEKSFMGTLKLAPYPHLLVDRPGTDASSAYYLVAPFKFGLDTNKLAELDGRAVTLKGTLIYRENQTMVEVKPGSIREASGALGTARPTTQNLGRQTLTGEIVDSKCYFGVMNPGQLAPHRACAVRCISGGIPPVLLVRQKDGPPLYFLLVGEDGSPVNKQVLDIVAVPLTVTGEVARQGELLILRANPATFKPVSQE
jgi:hypothetical protein